MSTTIAEQVRTYRQHAAAQRRMVDARNRVHLAGGEPRWTERSLQINEARQAARSHITTALRDAGLDVLAEALNAEAQVQSQLSGSKMSGKTNVGELTERRSAIRRVIRDELTSATATGRAIAEFRRHAAAVRRLSCNGSDSPRTREAIVEHRDAAAHLAADLPTDLAYALETEHHLLERADRYRQTGGREGLNRQLALVRRVIRRAAR